MKPTLVQNEIKEPEPRLGRHPPADPPAVLRVLEGVVTLPDAEADLPQHCRQFVGPDLRVELTARQQGIAEPDDRFTVRDLKLLQVPQQQNPVLLIEFLQGSPVKDNDLYYQADIEDQRSKMIMIMANQASKIMKHLRKHNLSNFTTGISL